MKLDTSTILNVIIALIAFQLIDKLLLSKIPFFSYEEDNFEPLND